MPRERKKFQYPGEICRPDERIVERISVEPFRPAHVPSVELASIQELETLIRPMGVPTVPRAMPPPPELVPTLVQEIKNKRYKNFTLDLNVERTNEPLGLRDMGIVADTMTIISITAGASFTYKLNSPTNDPTPATVGMQETEFEIEEIYITNTPQGADTQALIRVNWNPFLIRVKP